MSEPMKMILDVDTGTDDAIAIICAYMDERIDLLAVCTTAGNKPLDKTTENTLRVRELLGADFPVYRGCGVPMVGTMLKARCAAYDKEHAPKYDENGKRIEYHTDYLELPPSTTKVETEHAVWYYIDTLMKSEGDITVVLTGPMTNLAMALRLEPQIAGKIRKVVLMGGGILQTNVTAAAEHNIWADPEAAQILMEAGFPLWIVPLDATHRACITAAESAYMKSLGTPVGELVASCMEQRIFAYGYLQPMDLPDSAPVHDALAVQVAVDPSVVTRDIFTRVDVDISGGYGDGQTIVDMRAHPTEPRNATFVLEADRDRHARWVIGCVERFGRKA